MKPKLLKISLSRSSHLMYNMMRCRIFTGNCLFTLNQNRYLYKKGAPLKSISAFILPMWSQERISFVMALAVAGEAKKPLMPDLTGINCVNCRKMEGQVWCNPEVMKRLREEFVIVYLYVYVKNIGLQEDEHYYSISLNSKIETPGDKNADMQETTFGANSQAYYFFPDANENRLVPDGYGHDTGIK